MRGDVNGCAGDVMQWAGVSVSDERALAWPVRAFARGRGDSGGGWLLVGGGKRQKSDGAMFGNGWLPNIAIISNQALNY